MLEDQIQRANTLVEAIPYIKEFQDQFIVIKFGGSVMTDLNLRRQFATDIVLLRTLGIKPIIVHGGGKEISRWMEKIGKQPNFVDGLRYTDEETMEITEMVLSGKLNSELVVLLNEAGGLAVGLSGKDAQTFSAVKIRSKEGKDLGLVGDFAEGGGQLLSLLCNAGYIPVVSSIGTSTGSESLNMNADTVAAGLASSMKAKKLILLTDVQGLSIEGKLIQVLGLGEAQSLLSHKDIQGGMLPKLTYSIRAMQNGVEQVHIINGSIQHAVLLELFTKKGIGTMIRHAEST